MADEHAKINGVNTLLNGWFSEVNDLWPGQAMSLEVENVLHHEKSKYQDILVFQSKTYGTVLVLDGVIQATERDEFSYQEMISLLPLTCHPNPKKVLIIGGGDGGVAREVAKYPLVEKIVMCEIDERVTEVSKKYLPKFAVGFESPKFELKIKDGFEFMKEHEGEFDVIITDSSDPIGPAESLFQRPYYELMKKALRPGGIVCCQGECAWLHLELIKPMTEFCKELYPVVDYGYCTIPTYPSGQIGFLLCSLNPETTFKEPYNILTDEQIEKMNLKYYNPDCHRGAFLLPEFVKKVSSQSTRINKMAEKNGEAKNIRGLDVLHSGWFSEVSEQWPGQAFSLEVEKVLHHEHSKFQEILFFQSKTYGPVLVLDGVIQNTKRDEFAYQEMISFLPLTCHPNPEKVLIIGGGDGGVAREVSKYPTVKKIVMCEIDGRVIELSKKYTPHLAVGLDSPKLQLEIRDGFEFMKENKHEFDIIITDSSDPIGPAEALFKKPYYELMKDALREGGIICCQGECIWLDLELIKNMRAFCKELFPVVDYGFCTIPTYTSGQIGFTLCSCNPEISFKEPLRILSEKEVSDMELKYYNPEVHRGAFLLPQFVKKDLMKI